MTKIILALPPDAHQAALIEAMERSDPSDPPPMITLFRVVDRGGIYLMRYLRWMLSPAVMDIFKNHPALLVMAQRDALVQFTTELMLRNYYFPWALCQTNDPKTAIERADSLLLAPAPPSSTRFTRVGDIVRTADDQLFVISAIEWDMAASGAGNLVLKTLALAPLPIRLETGPITAATLFAQSRAWKDKPALSPEEYQALGFRLYTPITTDEARALIKASS